MNWILSLKIVFIACLLLSPQMIFAESSQDALDNEQHEDSLHVIKEAIELFKFKHLNEVEQEELEEQAIDGMLRYLDDPYARYFNPEEWEQEQSLFKQQYVGVGIRTIKREQGEEIVMVHPDSPADRAGIRVGDVLTHVNNEAITGKHDSERAALFNKHKDGKVALQVVRGIKELSFELTQELIVIQTVESILIDQHIGYMKLTQFADETDEAFAEQLHKLKDAGAEKLILDLRDNPGGSLDTTIEITKQFVDKGILMYVKSKQDVAKPVVILDGQDSGMDVIMLVNSNSASASEVFSGALQELIDATVIGEMTYGKGHIQEYHELSNGGGIKFTVAEYLTPSKQRVHGVGIQPDIEISDDTLQLIEALKLAGVREWDIMWKDNRAWIQGIVLQDNSHVIERNGTLYVSLRSVAAITGMDVEWDSEEKSVRLSTGDQDWTLMQDEIWLKSNTSYIAAQDIGQKLHSMTIETQGPHHTKLITKQ